MFIHLNFTKSKNFSDNKGFALNVIILTASAFLLIISNLIISKQINKSKLSYKTKAVECNNGEWRTECLNPKERQSCPENAGVEQVFLCENGQWVYKYPQCAVRCAPDSGVPAGADSRCIGKTPVLL
jgi:hypothetical protein